MREQERKIGKRREREREREREERLRKGTAVDSGKIVGWMRYGPIMPSGRTIRSFGRELSCGAEIAWMSSLEKREQVERERLWLRLVLIRLIDLKETEELWLSGGDESGGDGSGC